MSSNQLPTFTSELLSPADAIRRMKVLSRGRKVFVYIRMKSPLKGDPDHTWTVHNHAQLTHAAGVKFIQNGWKHAPAGAMVELSFDERCLFIG